MSVTVRQPTLATARFQSRLAIKQMLAAPAIWLGLLAVLLYAQPALRVVQLSPDAVEYVDVARRLVAGEGYRLGIKAYHVGGTDVVHDGLDERAPLFTLLIAGILGLGLDLHAVQVMNTLLAGACVAMVYAIAVAAVGRRSALLTGVLAATSPVMLVRMVPPMSEALAVALLLLAIWSVVSTGERYRVAMFGLAGVALGLSYLARPTSLVLAGALVLGVILAAPDRRAIRKPVGALLSGLGALVAPIAIFSVVTRGSLSYSGQTYLYSVFKDADVLRNGYGRPIPSPTAFISENLDFVASAIVENIVDYAHLVFLDPDWLLVVLPAWPAFLLALIRGRYDRSAWPVLLVAAANFAVYAMTWANFQERYQLLTLLLLLPFAVDGLGRLGLAAVRLPSSRFGALSAVTGLHLAVVAIVVYWLPAYTAEYRGEFRYGDDRVRARSDRGVRWTGPPRWVADSDLSRLVDWINSRTEPADALAHGQPWPFTFFTGRPTTLLPTKLTPEQLQQFIADYDVAYVLLDTRDRDRRGYQDDLEALAPQGVRVVPVGQYRVFDTRPLRTTDR